VKDREEDGIVIYIDIMLISSLYYMANSNDYLWNHLSAITQC